MSNVAYNPDDPLQAAFLSALAQGESGGYAGSQYIGVGGANLESAIMGGNVDEYGFPTWQGMGNSHAAGTYQFQPATWDAIASKFNLNFANANDQAEGAWYLAEETDPTLYEDLQSGNYQHIQDSLKNVWTSVTGNGAAPQGLAAGIAENVGTNSAAQSASIAANNASGATSSGSDQSGTASGGNWFSNLVGGVEGAFAQWGLIIIGAVIIFVALWMLLAQAGAVPSPKDAVKGLAL